LNNAFNNDPLFNADEGIKRRGLLVELTNRFVDKEAHDKANSKKGLFIKDDTLIEKFKDDNYKRAFIALLLPYCRQYYTQGLSVPAAVKKNFDSLCAENDDMSTFIEEFIDITDNDDDRIHKDEFLSAWNSRFGTKISWAYLLSDIKRKLRCDKEKRKGNRKGVVVGVKFKAIGAGDDAL
jgi:hypothetical protein